METEKLPVLQDCSFAGYDPSSLMAGTAKLRKIIRKRGAHEMLQRGGILERRAYNESPPRVEYRLTDVVTRS